MKRVISLFMTVLMIFGIFSFADATAMAAFTEPEGRILTALTEYDIAPGIKEQHIVTNNSEGTQQVKAYVAIADFNNPNVGFLAGYKDYDSSGKWGMQTVRDQAVAAEKATGVDVVAGINADYFDMQTGQPYGALIMDGKVVNSPSGQPHYFAVLNDGTPVIRDSSVAWDDVKCAIGAPLWIVKNSKVLENPDTSLLPRSAIGITADNKVIIYTADGRQPPTSVGETVHATAEMMKALGCVNAVYLDGGGSTTFASQLEDESGMTVKNKPSDGTERKVSTAVLIYTTANINTDTSTPSGDTHTKHEWVDATCTSAKMCSVCKVTEGSPLGHSEKILPAKSATCTAKGLTEGKKCSVCDTITVAQKEFAALGHKEVAVPGKAATCTSKGLTEGKKCSVCGVTTVAQKEIPATGHKEAALPAKAATYTADGLTAGKKCSVCGKVTVAQKKVARKTLGKVKNLKAKETTTSTVKLSWSKVTGAESYKVYYSTNGKSWKSVKATKNTATVKKLKSGTSYQFKVKAVAGKYSGTTSSVVKTATKVNKVTISSVKSSKKNTAVVTWKKVTGASGYVVEYSTSKKFTSKTTKKVTVKKGSTTKTTLKKLKSGKKYYVRVKAYKTVNKKAVYGSVSTAKTVKVK